MKKLLFIFFSFFSINFIWLLHAAPLWNIPIKISQPDGTDIWCFTSGDEYYHWLHDNNGNVIVQDSLSHYYCYIEEDSDSLIVVDGSIDTQFRLIKNAYDPQVKYGRCVERDNQTIEYPYSFSHSNDRNITTINNIVIYITFSDQSDYTAGIIDTISARHVDSAINANSMKQYFWSSSYNQLSVNSTFYPSGLSVFSYQDNNPRNYYCPYSNTNPIGYTTSNRKSREQSLLAQAITFVQNQIPSSLDLDTDNDGRVDNISFVIKGGTTEWNTLLWPHKWSLTAQQKYINGKRVYNYNLQLSDYIIYHGLGVLCHEFGHTLGLPDLYHGYQDPATGITWNPIGCWDIMAANGYYPQQTSGYMKYKYLHWIDSIPEITHSGQYTLLPITSSDQCYKINIDGSNNEYLYLEYRNKTHFYDTSLPQSGLLIYRVNSQRNGNFNAVECGGVNDEIYVYRPYGTLTSDGYITLAPFCSELADTIFNEVTNPQEFLSNGAMGNIYFSKISSCDSIISFNVKICRSDEVVYTPNDIIPTYTNAKTITNSGNVVIENAATFEAAERIKLNNGFKVLAGRHFKATTIPCE